MIPNILTTVRLFLVPIFAYLMIGESNYYLAAVIFLLSGITDVVDGYIARHYKMITNFGKVYDPFVDKLMQITAVVCLVIEDLIPEWLLIVVILKEVTMIIAGGILYIKKIVVSSNWSGKLSTVIFYLTVLSMMIWDNIPTALKVGLLSILVVSMLVAACYYIVDIIKNYEKKRI